MYTSTQENTEEKSIDFLAIDIFHFQHHSLEII